MRSVTYHIAAIVCVIVLRTALPLEADTAGESLHRCQNTISTETRNFLNQRLKAVRACLHVLSREVIREHNPDAVNRAAPICVPAFRRLKDSRGLGESLEERLTAAIQVQCDFTASGVMHTLADILGNGAEVAEPLWAVNLDAYCANFGGDGAIESLEEWRACLVAASTRAAAAAMTAMYPRALEWLDLVRPAMASLQPPEEDPTRITDALAALDAVKGELDGQLPPNPIVTCGNGIVDSGEACDWTNLNGQTCAEQGFVGGTLACTPGQCTFDTSGCSAVRFIDNGDGTISDVQTGLMWEKKDDAGGAHDKDLIVRWQDELPETSIHEWLSQLNGHTDVPDVLSGFAGYTDWRLPTIVELQTIVDLNSAIPTVEPIFNTACTPGCTVTTCSCTAAFVYWSSTTTVSNPLLAWTVLFFDGSPSTKTKDDFAHMRAVRGGR
jgi:hypothetical protein